MICIKTGALVLLKPYDAVVVADVFLSHENNTILIQYVGEYEYSFDKDYVTHCVMLDSRDYTHDFRKVIVTTIEKMRIMHERDASLAIMDRPDLRFCKVNTGWLIYEG